MTRPTDSIAESDDEDLDDGDESFSEEIQDVDLEEPLLPTSANDDERTNLLPQQHSHSSNAASPLKNYWAISE